MKRYRSSQYIEAVLEDALDNLSIGEVVSMWNIFAEENNEPPDLLYDRA